MNDLTVDRPEAAKAEHAQRGSTTSEPESARDERQPDRRTLPMAALAAAALAACGDGSDGAADSDDGATLQGLQRRIRGGYHSARSDAEAARFLLQAQAYATTADIAAVRANTFANWLGMQYAKPVGPTGWDWLNARGYATIDSTTPPNSGRGFSGSLLLAVCSSSFLRASSRAFSRTSSLASSLPCR